MKMLYLNIIKAGEATFKQFRNDQKKTPMLRNSFDKAGPNLGSRKCIYSRSGSTFSKMSI